jgi:type I restriction enzyme S subunit
MASEWKSSSFGNLIASGDLEIGDGYRAKNNELCRDGTGPIFLRAGHVSDGHIDFDGVERFSSSAHQSFGPKVSRPGDVVVTTKGNSTGRVAFVSGEMPLFVYSPHLSYWRTPQNGLICQRFLRAWSRSDEFVRQMLALSRSTDMAPYLSLTDQRRLLITIPPKEIQVSIGELADSINTRVDLLRQNNATLEAIAQALFKSWFVDFDPVRAKAEGREPEGMDADTAVLFPGELEESELGLIPKGWKVTPFTSGYEFTMGQSPPGESYNEEGEGVPFFQGCADFGDVSPSIRVYTNAPTRFARSGDVLMSVRAPVGDVNLSSFDCSIGRGLCAIRHKSGSTGLTLASIGAMRSRIETAAGEGALFKSLSKKQLADLPILSFGDQLAVAAARILDPLAELRLANAKRIDVLISLRDTLLARLISGKLQVPDAAAIFDESIA